MQLRFDCPSCGKTYDLPWSMAGKRARCNKCSHEFTIPAPFEPKPPRSSEAIPVVQDPEPPRPRAVAQTMRIEVPRPAPAPAPPPDPSSDRQGGPEGEPEGRGLDARPPRAAPERHPRPPARLARSPEGRAGRSLEGRAGSGEPGTLPGPGVRLAPGVPAARAFPVVFDPPRLAEAPVADPGHPRGRGPAGPGGQRGLLPRLLRPPEGGRLARGGGSGARRTARTRSGGRGPGRRGERESARAGRCSGREAEGGRRRARARGHPRAADEHGRDRLEI